MKIFRDGENGYKRGEKKKKQLARISVVSRGGRRGGRGKNRKTITSFLPSRHRHQNSIVKDGRTNERTSTPFRARNDGSSNEWYLSLARSRLQKKIPRYATTRQSLTGVTKKKKIFFFPSSPGKFSAKTGTRYPSTIPLAPSTNRPLLPSPPPPPPPPEVKKKNLSSGGREEEEEEARNWFGRARSPPK